MRKQVVAPLAALVGAVVIGACSVDVDRYKYDLEDIQAAAGAGGGSAGKAGAAGGGGSAGGKAGQAGANPAGAAGQAGASGSAGVAGSTAGTGGSTAGTGGSTAGTGGSTAGTGGSTAGTGGSTAGTGGSTAGTGGSTAGTGGSTAGTGGSTAGTGGSTAGTGGSTAGTGGSTAGTGGSTAGTGGAAGGPGCGNGIAELGEQCDGADLKGKTDCAQIFAGTTGPLACKATCKYDNAGCTALPVCGNGQREGTEECDLADLSGKTCKDALGDSFALGTLTCVGCTIDAGNCYIPPHCGDGVVNTADEECDTTLAATDTCGSLLGGNYVGGSVTCGSNCKVSYANCTPKDGHDGPPTVAVQIGVPPGQVSTGIHATEVTRAQYAKFIEATGGTPSASGAPECSFDTTTIPNAACMAQSGVCGGSGLGCAQHPQVCVDPCDAKAYCAWAGKHLCAAPGGAPLAITERFDYSKAVWIAACADNDKYRYAYGTTFMSTKCNTQETGNGSTLPVGSEAGCKSASSSLAGLVDMFGNVAEWNDVCSSSGGGLSCQARGASFNFPGYVAGSMNDGCSTEFFRDGPQTDIGFRCCD